MGQARSSQLWWPEGGRRDGVQPEMERPSLPLFTGQTMRYSREHAWTFLRGTGILHGFSQVLHRICIGFSLARGASLPDSARIWAQPRLTCSTARIDLQHSAH